MNKELLCIEFRHYSDGDYKTKTVTIGVYDTLEAAVSAGNDALKLLSTRFEVRANDRFTLNGFFGRPNRLVTNTSYPTNRVEYFAKITKLDFDDLNDVIECFFPK